MKKRILIVDDMDAIRDIVSATLVMKGYEIDKAKDGKEALDILKKEPQKHDLVLSDYDMPNMTGYELLKSIRTYPSLKNKPFIILTSRNEPDKIRAAKEQGLSAWITKPYKIDSFLSQIEYATREKTLA